MALLAGLCFGLGVIMKKIIYVAAVGAYYLLIYKTGRGKSLKPKPF